MTEYRIGCSGWSYKGWVGPFYPSRTKSEDFLRLYSRVFDTVEIDSTFYSIPALSTVENWFYSTPGGFVFCPKIPQKITHELKLSNSETILESFLSSIRALKGKLGIILIQLPPSFSYDLGFEKIKSFVPLLPQDLNFAVEFRHNSFFREDVFSFLEKNQITVAWSEVPMAEGPPIINTQYVYLRLVGDRSIREEDFGTLQRDRSDVIHKWAQRLEEKNDDILRAYVYSNNHFQGFAPGTVNIFRKAIGLKEVNWDSVINTPLPSKNQTTLF